jgi:hypothetical protein
MLGRIGNAPLQAACESRSAIGWERDEQEDMKKGIDYLYEFKKKLRELHPSVLDAIENMLQRPRY